MTIDPAVLIAAIAALAGFVGFIFRLFLTGAIHSRNVVPREDYDLLVAAIPKLTDATNRAVDLATEERARNGGVK